MNRRNDVTAVRIVAVMKIWRRASDTFRAYETLAARVMRSYGGSIERTVVADDGGDDFTEIHMISFPTAEAFAEYREDPDLAAARHLREQSVIDTVLHVGTPGPDYHESPDPAAPGA